jgi:hypothetical protein
VPIDGGLVCPSKFGSGLRQFPGVWNNLGSATFHPVNDDVRIRVDIATSEDAIMRFLSGIATALVTTFALMSTVPVDAAPIFVPRAQGAQSDVIQVRDGWYRGYRHHHRHNDFWAPGGAFVAGALLGSVIANNNGYYGGYYRGGDYYGDPYRSGQGAFDRFLRDRHSSILSRRCESGL